MRRGTAAILVIALTAAAAFSSEARAARRALTPDDIYLMESVSAPQLSPDGQWIAYLVSTSDREADEERSAVWMVSWDGSAAAPAHAALSQYQLAALEPGRPLPGVSGHPAERRRRRHGALPGDGARSPWRRAARAHPGERRHRELRLVARRQAAGAGDGHGQRHAEGPRGSQEAAADRHRQTCSSRKTCTGYIGRGQKTAAVPVRSRHGKTRAAEQRPGRQRFRARLVARRQADRFRAHARARRGRRRQDGHRRDRGARRRGAAPAGAPLCAQLPAPGVESGRHSSWPTCRAWSRSTTSICTTSWRWCRPRAARRVRSPPRSTAGSWITISPPTASRSRCWSRTIAGSTWRGSSSPASASRSCCSDRPSSRSYPPQAVARRRGRGRQPRPPRSTPSRTAPCAG